MIPLATGQELWVEAEWRQAVEEEAHSFQCTNLQINILNVLQHVPPQKLEQIGQASERSLEADIPKNTLSHFMLFRGNKTHHCSSINHEGGEGQPRQEKRLENYKGRLTRERTQGSEGRMPTGGLGLVAPTNWKEMECNKYEDQESKAEETNSNSGSWAKISSDWIQCFREATTASFSWEREREREREREMR